jgi:hypothetical protein
MKFFVKLIVVLATIVALFFVVALFVDDSFKVEKSKTIQVNHQVAFDYISNLKNQKDFGAWFDLDPKMKIWYEGNPGEVGSKVCWKSKNKEIGRGEEEIIRIQDGKRIDFKLRIFEPEPMEAELYMETKPLKEETTKIIWALNGEISYPWNIILLFNDVSAEIVDDLEKGLENLKPILEKR